MQGRIAQRGLRTRLIVGVVLLALASTVATPTHGEGSGTLYRGNDPAAFRSHLEWRTATYGGGDSPEFTLLRRTLLKLYARAGETILLGSSGIGAGGTPDAGDIRVFNPGVVTGTLGQEIIPVLASPVVSPTGVFANGFSCLAQRAAEGDERGRIASRAQELAGPLPATGGYNPCVYVAPTTGIYSLVFTGPSGDNANLEPLVSGQMNLLPADFGPSQRTSVTAWDATVREAAGTTARGRLFTYYYTGNTGGGGRAVGGGGFVVTDTGFRYRIFFSGDPFGFVLYANQFGFQNSDGTPLYRNIMADPAVPTQQQNELRELQGNVRLLPPKYPIFLDQPELEALDALNIPREPIAPFIRDLVFDSPTGGINTAPGAGGTFAFTTTTAGVYYVVVSRDGTNFDPTEPGNRVLRGVASAPGLVSVAWDGRDNANGLFPTGEYIAAAAVQGGEIHFPFLDVENNLAGGPIIELANPPDITNDGVADCPPWNGGCFGAFYDDRGYEAADGTLVGTAVNGPLCIGDAQNPRGFGRPPLQLASDPLLGFDSRTNQRSFGFPGDANPAAICLATGGFGDKKGLDLWTYYPSNVLRAPLRILEPTAATLRSLTLHRVGDGVVVRWETVLEPETLGFRVLRSDTGELSDAHIVSRLMAARGDASRGAVYHWRDHTAPGNATSYWLQEVEEGGGTRLFGPLRASTAAPR